MAELGLARLGSARLGLAWLSVQLAVWSAEGDQLGDSLALRERGLQDGAMCISYNMRM